MDSNYVKELEEEIKKRKAENDFQFNLAQINNQKIEKENSDLAESQHQFEQEEEIEQEHEQEQEQEQDQDQDQEQNEFEKSQNNNNFEEEEDNDLVNEGIKSLVSDDNKKNEQNEENINYDLQDINEPKTNSKFQNIISMNSFSVCQCCNKEFDSKKNIPYLLKCNHFFCKTCLENYFTDEEGIKCPIDGLVGKSLNDIKIMKNYVDNNKKNDINNNNKNSMNNNKKNDKRKMNKNNIRNNNGKELKDNNKNMNRNKENKINLNMFNNNNNDENEYEDNDNENFNENSNTNDDINNKQFSSNKKKNSAASKKGIKKNYSQNNNKNDNSGNNNISNNNINEKDGEENVDDSPGGEEYSQNYCNIHPEQKITHFVEDTKELICIHCAFNKLKNNPTILIKEISEKCKEYLNDLDNIIDNNQKYSQIIQNSLNDINENKENEEKKIIEIYEQLLNLLVTNRNNFLIKIEEIYQENTGNMNKKLENFSEIIDIAEKLKEDFEAIADQAPYEFNHLTQAFNKFIREMNDKSKSDLEIMQYNFSHDELNKVLRYLNNFSDVKTRKKCFRFDFLKNNGSQNYAIREINNYNNYNNFMNRNISMNNMNENNNVFNNGINKYYKASKGLSYINFNNSNNSNTNMMGSNLNIIPQAKTQNIVNVKNDSLLEGNNSNLRFNFKYEDSTHKDTNRYNLNNNNNNNFNGNTISESINATLNKYIIPNNNKDNLKDNFYNNNNDNKSSLKNFQNSGIENMSNNSINNSGIQGNYKDSDKLAILNKYKIPSKKK